MTNQSHTELAALARETARSLRLVSETRRVQEACDTLELTAAALESPERVQGEARLQQECDTITELNHAQWLAIGKASLLVAACNRLSAEAEEFDFDDGLGRGAQQAYWDEFESALEHAMEAMAVANKTAQRIHATPPTAPAQDARGEHPAPYRCIKPHCTPNRCDGCNHAIPVTDEAKMIVTTLLDQLAFDELGLPFEEGDSIAVDKARAWLCAPTPSPQAEKQPLSDEQMKQLWNEHERAAWGKTLISPVVFGRAIERAHGIVTKEST